MGVVAVESEVVDEEHRVSEVSQRKAGIRSRELLVHDAHGHGVEVGTAIGLVHRQAEQAQLAHGPHQVEVEPLEAVVLVRLRLNVLLNPLAHHLTQHEVGLGGVCKVVHHGAHQTPRPAVAI